MSVVVGPKPTVYYVELSAEKFVSEVGRYLNGIAIKREENWRQRLCEVLAERTTLHTELSKLRDRQRTQHEGDV